MQIILVSGDGIGAGKTTFANTTADMTVSLAGALRRELQRQYPGYDWYNKTQKYKDTTRVKEANNKTIRHLLIEHGTRRTEQDPAYWARLLADYLEGMQRLANGVKRVAVDDVRRVAELEYLRSRMWGVGCGVVHYHISNPEAAVEPEFDNMRLRDMADYLVQWRANV